MYICKKIHLSHWSVNEGKNFLMAYFRYLSYIIFLQNVSHGRSGGELHSFCYNWSYNSFEIESWADWCICLAEYL